MLQIIQNNLLHTVSNYISWIIPILCVFLGVIIDIIRQRYNENKKLKQEKQKQKQENEMKKLEATKHEEELNKIKGLIKSEIELNVENLKKYNERYLKMNISDIPSLNNRNKVFLDFYKNLNSFPILMKCGIIMRMLLMRFF